jgi:arsenite methyltransferase
MHNPNPPIGSFDIFRDVENWDKKQAQYWISALIQRASAPDQITMRKRLLQQSNIQPGNKVLELGCGTGRLLVELAKATGPFGHVWGLEPQPFLARETERFITEQNLSSSTSVLAARAEKIPIPDASIDICVAQITLIHIPANILMSVFTEITRILKPGGRFISVDQDGDTWVIDHPQRTLTRKIIQFNSDYRYADGWTGRYLRRLFIQNGFDDVRIQVWSHSDTERGSYLHAMALRIAQSVAEHEAISQDECKRWVSELEKRTDEGNFFSSICYLCCQGTKPVALRVAKSSN